MDDMYVICRDRETRLSIIAGIEEKSRQMGLFVNPRKTRICRLSDTYQYLQVKYSLSETGRVIKRINPKSVTRERRRIKAYKRLMDRGELKYRDIEQAVKSWMGEYTKLMSKKQVQNMKLLYKELFGREIKWKQS